MRLVIYILLDDQFRPLTLTRQVHCKQVGYRGALRIPDQIVRSKREALLQGPDVEPDTVLASIRLSEKTAWNFVTFAVVRAACTFRSVAKDKSRSCRLTGRLADVRFI
jgi:hypothetical protein